jgi:hypothetical protein
MQPGNLRKALIAAPREWIMLSRIVRCRARRMIPSQIFQPSRNPLRNRRIALEHAADLFFLDAGAAG